MLPQSHFIALKKTNIFSNALRDFAFTLSAAWPPGLLLWHRWRNLFQSEEAQMHVEKKLLHIFLFWLRNCDITCIEIWRLFLYTIWRSKFHYFRQNYTTVTTYRWTTSNSNRLLHGRTRQVICVTRANHTIHFEWLNKTVRSLRHWNFHLLSFRLGLSVPARMKASRKEKSLI